MISPPSCLCHRPSVEHTFLIICKTKTFFGKGNLINKWSICHCFLIAWYRTSKYLLFKSCNFMLCSWFFGAVTRKHAENLLMRPFNGCGSFLVRNSESTPGYALSIRFENSVTHYIIRHNEEGYCISKLITFESIHKLVAYYSERPDGLSTNLKSSCLITDDSLSEVRETDRSSVQFVQKLGGGRFGEVWQGMWHGVIEVAVKKLHPGIISANEFFEEVVLIRQLRHPKLIQLFAVCTREESIYIIMELMKHGSLLEYLRGDGLSLKFPQLLDMGIQITAGMAYLEERNYIHRDLAARNVLVSEDHKCKVDSISMARILSDNVYEAYTGAKFPIRWTAPEAVSNKHFTTKSDMWSFGILLYELITFGRFPYPGMNDAEVLEKLQTGYRMPRPNDCPLQLYKIMRECWRTDADSRPTFESLQRRMEDLFVENECTHSHPHQVK